MIVIIPFEKSFASHPKNVFWSQKNSKNPRQVYKSTAKMKYLFDCGNCNHEFSISTNDVSNGSWCPFCSNKVLCDELNCKVCWDKSFASSLKSESWSSSNIITPRKVFTNSHQKYMFDCIVCKHTFTSRLNEVSKGCWCRFCSNNQLCGNIECKVCYNKSFASHPKSEYWSNENTVQPINVFKNTAKKYVFQCQYCSHQFDASICHVTRMKNPAWCPFCGKKRLCSKGDCKFCFEKSFASNQKSIYWSSKNITDPRSVFKTSGYKYVFKCNVCNSEFSTRLYNITKGGCWCPICKHKTEQKLFDWLKSMFKDVKFQVRFQWCKKINCLPFDFVINDKVIVELDGPQHFRQISNWQDHTETQKVDKYKDECAINNKYSIIRIEQETVHKDLEEWQKVLEEKLKTLLLSSDFSIIKIGRLYVSNL